VRYLLFTATALKLTSLALAQPAQGPFPGGRFLPPIDPLIQKLDANSDGQISAEEIAQAHEALKALDLNKDGQLTFEELRPNFPGSRPGSGGPGGMGPNRTEQKLTEKFDLDKNGYLDPTERQEALKVVQAGGRPGGPPGRRPRGGQSLEGKPGPKVSPEGVKNYPEAELYDPSVLRTVFIDFDTETWEEDMARFKYTDVEMPATVTVDGKKYPMVGVKFRGQSSFGHVPSGSKRSLNLSMDFINRDQRLYGFKTINLLNCNGDASFLSSILYSHLAADYLPAPKANIMKVIINGESWGVYCNVQQFNKDFLKEFYGTTAGARWKVSGSPQADGGLRYLGENIDPYRQRFEIKSKDREDSWKALINLCKVLNETPIKDLPKAIEPLLNVDQVLRFLAIDVAVVNSDGYWVRASDYSIYLDTAGMFHIIPHDMNEAFRSGGPPGGGPPRGGFGRAGGPRGGRGHGGPTLDPLVGIENERMPLRSKLLAVPKYRQRYLQYIRSLAEKGLTYKNLSPVIAHYRKLIGEEIKNDTRKRTPYESFTQATSPLQENGVAPPGSLNDFIGQRHDFLMAHAEIKDLDVIDFEKPIPPRKTHLKRNTEITVAISEFLASNQRTNKDPQGQFEDWIELFNHGNTDIELSGMYLSDDNDNPFKWKIPTGTIIKARDYLIIWADEDEGDEGLHANFKLSKGGEIISLIKDNTIVDQIEFGPQASEVSSGRLTGHTGKLENLSPTPGASNRTYK
tara:strand:- start:8546 stop:10768 length:2223 start_codon:yes stop_codon:yes gene_type:complete